MLRITLPVTIRVVQVQRHSQIAPKYTAVWRRQR